MIQKKIYKALVIAKYGHLAGKWRISLVSSSIVFMHEQEGPV